MGYKQRGTLECIEPDCRTIEQRFSKMDDEAFPPCRKCGAATAFRLPPGAGYYNSDLRQDGETFQLTGVNPCIDLGDGAMRTTREVEALAKSRESGDWRVEVEVVDSKVKARADDRRHAALERAKKKGVDAGLKKVFTEARLARSAEAAKAAAKDNKNPEVAAYQATKKMPTIGDAAKGLSQRATT